MSNLQIVLAIIGAVVVLGIYFVSKWQARARTPVRGDSERRFNEGAGDGDFGGDFISDEHSNQHTNDFGGELDNEFNDDINLPPQDFPEPDATAPTFDPPDEPADDVSNAQPTPPKLQTATGFHNRNIDGFDQLSQIDYWAKITGARDVGRESVLALYREGADFSKAHGIHGVKSPGNVWCDLELEAEDSRFTDLVVTIQLADRDGAIDERELARFTALATRIAEGTGREFVPMTLQENALAQADALADFIKHFDATYLVTIRPQHPPQRASGDDDAGNTHDQLQFSGDAIDRTAAQVGLERDDSRRYSRFKSVGRERVLLYSLADLTDDGQFDFDDMQSFTSRGLAFYMRPTVSHSPGAVFAEMADTAKAFAARIKGEVSVPNHDDFSQEEIDAIRRTIEREAADMEQLGIPAGGAEAIRLFNYY